MNLHRRARERFVRGLYDEPSHDPQALAVSLPARPWVDRAACRVVDPEVFFLDKGKSAAAAKRICRCCPVWIECLEYVMDVEEQQPGSRYGVFGGQTPRERAWIARMRERTSVPPADERTQTTTSTSTPRLED